MLYDIGFLIFSVFYLPALFFKGRLHRDFLERFGIYSTDKKEVLASHKDTIWIQAVSVGEVAVCKRLITLLKERFPNHNIVLSTITKTGNDLAKKLFGIDVLVIYFPLDFSFVVKKVVGLIKPRIYIMIETEIWPNLLKEISKASIPSMLINGRISDNSFSKYKLAKPFLKNILHRISLFCMQSQTYAERIIHLGAPQGNVRITGNMKFDAETATDIKPPQRIGELLGLKPDEELFVAGSTHRGEEGIVISVFKELTKEFPHLKLLIAPRHVERAIEIARLAKQLGFESGIVSTLHEPRTTNHEPRVFILDTIGQLKNTYAIATIVFVGGSLVRHGGQNPIEPALFEKPILFGPHMFNFRNIASIFLETGSAVQILNESQLLKASKLLLGNPQERMRLGRSAKSLVLENRGATERNLKAIIDLVDSR